MGGDGIRCKFQRGNNGDGRLESGNEKMEDQFQDDEAEGESERGSGAKIGGGGGGVEFTAAMGRFYAWPSSRIVRVSRASGGKDRHSKVLTSKGLRDRRVRLSVNTAIQFYDLQDRLGYDQPSKAVEWLLKAAASSIAELPPIPNAFPETPNQLSDEKKSSTGGSDQLGLDSAEVEMDGCGSGVDPSFCQQLATKSSACSSASETSKGSGLSLSRSEIRIKARERAKERVAEKEKEKENASMNKNNPISRTTSFTELLNGVGGGINKSGSSPNNSSVHENPSSGAAADGTATDSSFFLKSSKQWDYLCSGLLTPPPSGRGGEIHSRFHSPMFGLAAGDHQPELQQYSFVPDHLVQVVNGSNINTNQHNGSSHEYSNLTFSISSSAASSGLAGFNRGTLQSNSSSPSLLPHIQSFSDGSPVSFFAGVDNQHHQFLAGYDAGSDNGSRHSAHRGRGNN